MSEQETEEEPSIEEILTSIRQIISDDDEEGGEEAPAAAPVAEPAPEPEEAPEEDIVELTDKVEDEPEPEVEDEPVPEVTAEPEPEPIEIEMQDSAPPADAAAPALASSVDDSILTDTAEDAAFDAFSELAKKTAVEHGGITVEEIVRSELRPLLKGWLDKHLPTIIERLVQEELERVAKRAMED